MESIELVVYIFFAILAAGLLLMALRITDFKEMYSDWRGSMKQKLESPELFRVPAEGFAEQLSKRWEECRFGLDNASSAVYVEDNATIDRESLVRELLRVDRCDVIDCRNTSNRFVVNGTLTTPQIINIRCFNRTLIVT